MSKRRKCFVFLLTLFIAATLFVCAFLSVRASRKKGRRSPPPAGASVTATASEQSALQNALQKLGTWIVWSSNRSGTHHIYGIREGTETPVELTRSAFTDTYPRAAEDGQRIVFARSQKPWVSQRNFECWDTYLLNLETRELRLVATNAYQATWGAGNDVYFLRNNGMELVRATVGESSVTEELILKSGVPPCPEGVQMTCPDVNPATGEITLTLRGKLRRTAPYTPGKPEFTLLSGGCQMIWAGPRNVLWVEHGGRMKNAFYEGLLPAAPGESFKKKQLFDAEEPWSHEYFPRFSRNGEFLVFGASTGGHEQDSEDYEIFLLPLKEHAATPIRVSFHSGNDCWPEIL